MSHHERQGMPIEILLVEDSPADVELTKLGFLEGKIANNLNVTTNGDEAMAYLRRSGSYTEVPRPDLILLDLNLPGKDGREVLEEIKADPSLKQIPVVILTTSHADEDIVRAYGLHANAYMTKPVDFAGFVAVVKGITDYWFTLVKLPPR